MGEDARLRLARTNAEAHLYMDRHGCSCGDNRFDRISTVVAHDGDLASRYRGSCRNCGTEREFTFRLPAQILPHDDLRFGGPEPSELLDPGEWLSFADATARRVVPDRTDDDARRDLSRALAAYDEVLKFVPDGADRVPEAAFTSDFGRKVYAMDRFRFAAGALEHMRSALFGRLLDANSGPKWCSMAPLVPHADVVQWTAAMDDSAVLPVARTIAEARLYMTLHPCECANTQFEQCGDFVDHDGERFGRFTGPCAGCGTERQFLFRLPDRRPGPSSEFRIGGDAPSQLLDPGEWLAVADRSAERGDLDMAMAATDEVIKFVPRGATDVPESAFTTPTGRAMYANDPERFNGPALAAEWTAYDRQFPDPRGDPSTSRRHPRRPLADGALDTRTWRRDKDGSEWDFHADADLRTVVARVFAALAGFGVVSSAEWVTTSAGDDAVVHPRGTAFDAQTFATTFAAHDDVESVSLDIDLTVTEPDGVTEGIVRDGAQLNCYDDGTVNLTLHVDIHDHRTRGEIEVNDTLADLNAPRRTAFLARIAAFASPEPHPRPG